MKLYRRYKYRGISWRAWIFRGAVTMTNEGVEILRDKTQHHGFRLARTQQVLENAEGTR